jgi:hypothetical protein
MLALAVSAIVLVVVGVVAVIMTVAWFILRRNDPKMLLVTPSPLDEGPGCSTAMSTIAREAPGPRRTGSPGPASRFLGPALRLLTSLTVASAPKAIETHVVDHRPRPGCPARRVSPGCRWLT